MSARLRRVGRAPVLACLATAAALAAASPATAAPVQGPAGDAFYTPPAGAENGPHGDAVWYRNGGVSLSGTASSSTVLYRTQSATGEPALATGTVIVPSTPWTGGGARPVVSFAPGTQGMAPGCAPSRQLGGGMGYEGGNMAVALQKGMTVVVTDYKGATNGSTGQPYVVGTSEGRDVLDMVLAAQQIPNSGVTASSPVGIWGYSQGGGSAMWAGELKDSYAPSLNLKGVAGGGVPADLLAVGRALNGNLGAAFLGYAVVGFSKSFPSEINLASVTNDAGKALVASIGRECLFESLFKYAFQRIDTYISGGRTFDQIAALPGWTAVLNRLKLGQGSIPVPVLQYHAIADEIIPSGQAEALKQTYCRKGMKVQWNPFVIGEHLTAAFVGAADSVQWLSNRFAGQTPPSNC